MKVSVTNWSHLWHLIPSLMMSASPLYTSDVVMNESMYYHDIWDRLHQQVYVSRKLRWAWHVALIGDERYKCLVGNPIKIDHFEDLSMDWWVTLALILTKQPKGLDSISWLSKDWWQVPVNMVTNLQVPQQVMNFFTCYATISFSKRTMHHNASSWLHEPQFHFKQMSENHMPLFLLPIFVFVLKSGLFRSFSATSSACSYI